MSRQILTNSMFGLLSIFCFIFAMHFTRVGVDDFLWKTDSSFVLGLFTVFF